ncbi:MAG: diacylglycerol kinase family protein [Bacteroidia bacterium]
MNNKSFNVSKRIKSFGYAFNGLRVLITQEHNARIHLLAATIVVILGIVLHVSLIEWAILMLCIGVVIALEIVNTAIEQIANFICPEHNPKIKIIKDLAAAAVLVGAISASVIGLLIFVPKIMAV